MKRVFFILCLAACKQPDPPAITSEWTDNFERTDIGSDYLATSDVYKIENGALHVKGAYNHPLWLRRRLPPEAIIDFDVISRSPAGDIKVEVWGDGSSHADNKGAYTSSGYVFVHGGWGNSRSILARREEHGSQLAERAQPKVVVGQKYHWRITRKGPHIDWFIDDMTTPFLSYDDRSPLEGPEHVFFGFDNWESDLWFDNLTIRPVL